MALPQFVLDNFTLWCDIIKDRELETLTNEWIKNISKLDEFLKEYVKNACTADERISEINLWDEISIAFAEHETAVTFKNITKRVFKYCLQKFIRGRFFDVHAPRDTPAYRYLIEIKKCVNLLCAKENLNLLDTIEEALALAMSESINVNVLRRCKTLSDRGIFINVIQDTDAMCKYMEFFDLRFKEMQGPFKVFAIKTFIEHMITRCYELIVVSYPRTKVSLIQLMKAMKCLEWFGREKLVNTLILEIRKKLLQTSVSTKQILNSYANVVESLTFFDSSFVLVHRVCNVIKDYVITRPDTIKTIIKFITMERPGENSSNYCNLIFSENQLASVNDEYVLALEETSKNSWNQWKPDPHDANPYESRLYRQSADVFSMLVMIYGSKEMFVKEYHEFLASRLSINGWRRRFREELSYVDMMKNRFHEGELTQCEVMLKDIEDSQTFCKKLDKLDVRIISKEYWPQKEDKAFALVEPLQDLRESIGRLYEHTRKNNRKLRWFNNYGCFVDLAFEFGDVYVSVEVPMAHYLVITAFLENETVNIDDLTVQLGWEKKMVTEIIDWWIQQGCLTLEGKLATLNDDEEAWEKLQKTAEEQQKKYNEKREFEDESEDESDEGDDDGQNPRIDAMESFWTYSRNMLKISSRPHTGQFVQLVTSERLLAIFTMLSSPGKPPLTLEEVHTFMNRKIRANLVYLDNGVYKLTPEYLATLND
uniref:Cullin family profile domain-containing protein n=1 Tax=Panagrolaimus sp. ES5 TaxID=591445 RepID=A0AC34FXB2_9BILA